MRRILSSPKTFPFGMSVLTKEDIHHTYTVKEDVAVRKLKPGTELGVTV